MAIWTVSDRDEIKAALKALALGFKNVSVAGQSVTSHDIPALKELLNDIQGEVAVSDGASGLWLHKIKPRYE